MRTSCWSTICTLVATICQYCWGGGHPQVNKLEQVSSDGHKMSLVGGGAGTGVGAGGFHVWCRGPVKWGPMHHGQWSNGDPSPCGLTDTHEWKHYLPSTSLAGGKYNLVSRHCCCTAWIVHCINLYWGNFHKDNNQDFVFQTSNYFHWSMVYVLYITCIFGQWKVEQ